jgi:cytosine/adenosine deaminase-related metal-dependent hydrolase
MTQAPPPYKRADTIPLAHDPLWLALGQRSTADLHQTAQRLADWAVIADIESNGVAVGWRGPARVYDMRHMLDPDQHTPEVLDMMTQAMAYALHRGLIASVPGEPAGVVQTYASTLAQHLDRQH